jgi:stress response protein YsnF
MPVIALDGRVGSIASIPRIDLEDPTSRADIVVLANHDNAGPGVEEFLRVPRELVDRVEGDSLYLNVERRRVPRASDAVSATHRIKDSGSRLTLRAYEEVVEVTPQVVEKGYLSVQKKIDEYLDERSVELMQQEVHVERVPVDEIIPEYVEPYMDGDTYVVPVIEEEVVIQRRLRLKEELRVQRTVTARDETVRTPFRRERVVVTEYRYEVPEDEEPVER